MPAAQRSPRTGAAFSKALEKERLRVPSLQVITLSEVPHALHTMLQQRTVGKIVAEIGH